MSKNLLRPAVLRFFVSLGCALCTFLWNSPANGQDLRNAIRTRILERTQDVEVNTALVSYRFAQMGGTLSSVYLSLSTPWGAPPVEVLADQKTTLIVTPTGEKLYERGYPKDALFPFALTLGPLSPETIYQAELLPSENPNRERVRLSYQENNLKITKIFTVRNEATYLIEADIEIENLSPREPLSFPEGFQMTLGHDVNNAQRATTPSLRLLFDGVRSTEILRNYTHFNGLGFLRDGLVLWLVNDAHQSDIHPWESELSPGRRIYGVRSDALELKPQEKRLYRFQLYAGRSHLIFLEEAGLLKIIDSNIWDQSMAALTKSLQWLYQQTGNYGWALILLTLLIRLLMYPLTRAQFHSMARMKEIQPKLEKLQSRYPSLTQLRVLYPKMSEEELRRRARENREELTQKQMEFFRKAGVNPMSGCLPMILQIPVLILLWQVVLYSAELIHMSPGFLWMNDLSQPDPLYLIVALTVLAQIAQGRLTPTPGTSQNQLLIWVFPIVFGFLLKDLSSGLWLHYFISTLVQVVQQVVVIWELRRSPGPRLEEPEVAPESADGTKNR
ncbi:membrane protein insertase YidC [Candidatus Acetothermia bacterium]|jgi:YidC/Oxa1 family membrane protein insertase|nr:membrane protein insertase YidC [Candidatus Acetothermia bacterium]MCI2432129.1 membrane protein insertase YidC [Candidatus Acetothermia bacterium]MCI2436749.1 membrane protein insertase YidC [Candidatus Acetothermia bacterium]